MKPRVLVADDNANVRTALRLLLESERMQIDAVATTAEALERGRHDRYDAVRGSPIRATCSSPATRPNPAVAASVCS
jgi:CheY-like chemotaxis protein